MPHVQFFCESVAQVGGGAPADVAEFEVAQGALLEDGQGGVAVG